LAGFTGRRTLAVTGLEGVDESPMRALRYGANSHRHLIPPP
jgi:hypothetical protein